MCRCAHCTAKPSFAWIVGCDLIHPCFLAQGSEHSYKWMEYLRAVDREDYKVADLVFGSDCLSPELLKSVDEAARSVERETGKAEKAKAAKAAAQKGTL